MHRHAAASDIWLLLLVETPEEAEVITSQLTAGKLENPFRVVDSRVHILEYLTAWSAHDPGPGLVVVDEPLLDLLPELERRTIAGGATFVILRDVDPVREAPGEGRIASLRKPFTLLKLFESLAKADDMGITLVTARPPGPAPPRDEA